MNGQRRPLYGLIEAGGTKFVLGLAQDRDRLLATARIPTAMPDRTIRDVLEWFALQTAEHGPIAGLGIASFGPLVLDRASPDWGHLRQTTKTGWSGFDMAGVFAGKLDCPVAIDTDVNGAALAEYRWGAGRGARLLVYLTVGTGIGGGAIIDGRILHGASHPEMGHMRVSRHPDDHGFAGVCPAHGDCLEGLASGPAISRRWGAPLCDLPPDHPGHAMIAHYLGQAIVNIQAMVEPSAIVLGGGVMATAGLRENAAVQACLLGNGYFRGDPTQIVKAPGLGDHSGVLGALALIAPDA